MSYQNSYRRAFHGTSKAALASIVEKGLIPAASPGADAWARGEGKYFPPGRGVFLSSWTGIAAMFSQFAAQVRAHIIGRDMIDGGVVLEIDLSEADPSLITEDDSYTRGENNGRALIYHGAVPTSWIRCYHEVIPTEPQLPEYLTAEYMEEPDLKLGEPIALGVAA